MLIFLKACIYQAERLMRIKRHSEVSREQRSVPEDVRIAPVWERLARMPFKLPYHPTTLHCIGPSAFIITHYLLTCWTHYWNEWQSSSKAHLWKKYQNGFS
jgi:hypothetical protein